MERPDFKAIFLSGAEGQVSYALNLTLYLKGKAEINSLKTPEGSILQFKMERPDFKAIFLSGSEGQVTYAVNLTLKLK